MVSLRLMARKSIIRNKCYLKDRKEREAIVTTIEGNNYYNAIWLSDIETFSRTLSQISDVKRKMKMEATYNYLPTISIENYESLLLSKDMPSEESVSLKFIFRYPRLLSLVEVIIVSSSNKS